MPSVRAKVWDGRIRLFSPGTGKIYYGLLPYVQRFLTENGHTYNLSEDFEERKLERSLTAKFVWALQKGKLKAREYQIDAIHKIITDNRGLILSPTGSGKSFIIYALVRYYLRKQDKKILIIVPTTGLVEQMYNDFADYGWFPDEHCHKLYAGKDKNTSKEVVISTWQSIYNQPKKYFKDTLETKITIVYMPEQDSAISTEALPPSARRKCNIFPSANDSKPKKVKRLYNGIVKNNSTIFS